MPSVPNWIGHAVVILPNYSSPRPDEAVPVKSWRATKTQVVVTLDNPHRTEMRFYLDCLHGVGADRGAELRDATDPVTVRRVAHIRAAEAIGVLQTTMALARLDDYRGAFAESAERIRAIHDAATAALAALAEVL